MAWLNGDRATYRGQEVKLLAHSGQLPVELVGSGETVMVWADQLRPLNSVLGEPVPGEDTQ